jgi:hypothetical protein
MKLLVNIALFLLKKCIWVIVVFLLGVVLIGTINWTKSQFETEENRKAAVEKIKHEINETIESADQYKKRLISAKWKFKSQLYKVRQLKLNPPSIVSSPIEYLEYKIALQKYEELLEKYETNYNKVKMTSGRLLRPIIKLKNELTDSDRNKSELIVFVDKVKVWFITNGKEILFSISMILFFVFFGPLIWKCLWYYIIAPTSEYFSPIKLIESNNDGNIKYGKSDKIFSVKIEPKSSLIVKMDWVQRYNESGKKISKLFLDRSSPFISYASGLRNLTEIQSPEDNSTSVDIAHPKNPQAHILEVILENHPGIVVYPQNVVGLSGNLKLKSYWRLFNLHSWLTNQFRYIAFHGTGRIYLTGIGVVKPSVPGTNLSLLEQKLLIGFDGRLTYTARRTETFMPYLKKYATLTDNAFIGDFPYFYQSASTGDNKTQLDDHKIWTILGRFLGL